MGIEFIQIEIQRGFGFGIGRIDGGGNAETAGCFAGNALDAAPFGEPRVDIFRGKHGLLEGGVVRR